MSIKIERIVGPSVDQWKMAIEGMRIPLWSMDKSDSAWDVIGDPLPINPAYRVYIKIGPNDMALMRKLAKSGSDHRKFLRMLPIIVKVTGPMVWLMQVDTYKVGTVSCGSSKMHKLMHKPFELSDFSFDNTIVPPEQYQDAIDGFNGIRESYLTCEDPETKREIWQSLLDILPESYNQTRVLSLNYEVLWSMYNARKNHKLKSWHEFLDALIPQVPYFKEIFEI